MSHGDGGGLFIGQTISRYRGAPLPLDLSRRGYGEHRGEQRSRCFRAHKAP